MGKTAFVFPGQGAQAVGMGLELSQNYPLAKAAFEKTDKRLNEEFSKLIFEGPEEKLTLTANTQPAILTTSVAAWEILNAEGIVPDVVAGHSLGEYSAVVAAGGMSLEDAAWSVRQRGQLMQEAVPVGQGAMAALIGLAPEVVKDICETAAAGQVVSMANINSASQIVIAGHAEAVDRALELANEKGAKRAIKLQVSAPFHCSLMKPAQEGMVDVLSNVEITDLKIPLINNADVSMVSEGSKVKEGLIKQVVSPVRWYETMDRMVAEGVDTLVEIGPGKVLSGLMKRHDRNVKLFNVEDEKSLAKTLNALRG